MEAEASREKRSRDSLQQELKERFISEIVAPISGSSIANARMTSSSEAALI